MTAECSGRIPQFICLFAEQSGRVGRVCETGEGCVGHFLHEFEGRHDGHCPETGCGGGSDQRERQLQCPCGEPRQWTDLFEKLSGSSEDVFAVRCSLTAR